MSQRWMRAHQIMIDVIRCEEALLRYRVIAAGNGRMQKGDARSAMRAWQKGANRRPVVIDEGPAAQATMSDIAGAGIKFEIVPRRKKPKDG